VLSIGEMARGPGQDLGLTGVVSVLPLTLSGAAGATQVQFTLSYNPALLNVQGLADGNLPAGATTQIDLSVRGQLSVTVNSATPLGASVVLGKLLATLPDTAPYGAKSLLHWVSATVDQGTVAVRRDDGMLVVAYLGDASGDGSLSSLDFQRLNRVLLRQDSGLGAWPLVDPLLLGDIDRNGLLTSTDAMKVALQAGGVAQKDIAPIPARMAPLSFAGADPVVSLGQASVQAGSEVRVPVLIDTAADLQSVVLTLSYDTQQLRLLGVEGATLTAGFTAQLTPLGQGQVRLDASSALPLLEGSGVLFWLRFGALPGATVGTTALDLISARLNDSWLTLNPAPQAGADATDGQIHVLRALPGPTAAQGSATLSASGDDDEDNNSAAARPLLDFKRSGQRGFALGGQRGSLWLNDWLAAPETGNKAKQWSISTKAPTVH
jgi:hypothetical protein